MDEKKQKVLDLLDKVEERMDELTQRVNSTLSSLPFYLSWVADKFLAAWDDVLAKVSEFWRKVGEFVSWLGDPVQLLEIRDKWNEVATPIAARSVAMGRSAVDREWKGRAADAYADSIGDQKEALKAVQSSLTNPIGSALVPIATGIITFWVTLGVTIGTLVLGLVVCIAEAASGVGLPAVPPSALAAFGAAIASIVGGIAVLAATAYTSENSFQNVANEVAAFGPTSWPKAFE